MHALNRETGELRQFEEGVTIEAYFAALLEAAYYPPGVEPPTATALAAEWDELSLFEFDQLWRASADERAGILDAIRA